MSSGPVWGLLVWGFEPYVAYLLLTTAGCERNPFARRAVAWREDARAAVAVGQECEAARVHAAAPCGSEAVMAPLGRPASSDSSVSSASDAPSRRGLAFSGGSGLALSEASLVRQIRDDTRSCNGTAGGIRYCCAWQQALSTSRERTAFNAARLGRIGACCARRRGAWYFTN